MIENKSNNLIKEFKNIDVFFKGMTLRSLITDGNMLNDVYEDMADFIQFAAVYGVTTDEEGNDIYDNNFSEDDINFLKTLENKIRENNVDESDKSRLIKILDNKLPEFLMQTNHLLRKDMFHDYKEGYQTDMEKLNNDLGEFLKEKETIFNQTRQLIDKLLNESSDYVDEEISSLLKKQDEEIKSLRKYVIENDWGF